MIEALWGKLGARALFRFLFSLPLSSACHAGYLESLQNSLVFTQVKPENVTGIRQDKPHFQNTLVIYCFSLTTT